jgi:hypothetical protein
MQRTHGEIMKLQRLFLPAVMALFLAAAPAWADIVITLDSSTLSGLPGDTLTFTGTVQNLDSAIVDLNDCQVNLSGQFVTDCVSSFLTFAPYTLDPLATSFDFAMFTISVNLPYTDLPGLQSGSFDVLGGTEGVGGYDPSTQNLLGTADFSVNVVPEPGTASLLGLEGLFLLVTRFSAVAWRDMVKRRLKSC